MQIRIRGKTWSFVRKKIKGVYGMCDSPEAHKKQISVDPDLTGEEELGSILHECSHAAFWDLKEEAIDEATADIARVLWRLGYRKVEDVR